MIAIVFSILFIGNIHAGIIQVFNSSNLNETDVDQTLVILNNDNETIVNNENKTTIIENNIPSMMNETIINDNQSSVEIFDKNHVAVTVVDLLLDLLQKANLTHTISIIRNDTDQTELLVHDDTDIPKMTIKLSDP